MSKPLRIGLDFDNTIACYDGVFRGLALRLGLPADIASGGKTAIRDFLRSENREDEWTVMQGEAYGSQMHEARAFEGVEEFVRAAAERGHFLAIVSHRTKKPYLGEPYDLHEAARSWWKAQRFSGLISEVYFETTAEEKAKRIGQLNCDVFVDDLWEFLERPDLPAGLRKIWMDYGGRTESRAELEKVETWQGVIELLKAEW